MRYSSLSNASGLNAEHYEYSGFSKVVVMDENKKKHEMNSSHSNYAKEWFEWGSADFDLCVNLISETINSIYVDNGRNG